MTSDLRAAELIRARFVEEWPLFAIGVPCAVTGPPAPRANTFAHLEIFAGVTGGWIYVRMWCPVELQISGSMTLWDAAARCSRTTSWSATTATS